MSKAFVKDDGDEAEEDVTEDAPRPKGSAYITPAGFRRLQVEAERLWKVERPKITEEVAAAAAQGDRSENAEYIYGKKKLREIDRRIRFLTKRMDAVTVVETAPEQRDRVYFGARVTVEDEAGKEATYRIVGSDEIDLDKRWISLESPIARAMLGKRVGDDVTVMRPKGPAELSITDIDYEDAP
jgi:transcription elongation factor GreB